MEARAPFLEAPAPPLLLSQWTHTLHLQSEAASAPTCAHLPCCPHPGLPTSRPVLHVCRGAPPLLTPHPILLKVRGAELGPGQDTQTG